MGEVIKFESDNPDSWTVIDALERAIENVKSGKFPADKCYVALCERDETGADRISYTMAGMRLPEAIGWLFMHMNLLMTD